MMENDQDTYHHQLKLAEERILTKRQSRPFIKGPIPLDWISAAHQCSLACGALALALAWRAGITKQHHDLKLTMAHATKFGVKTRQTRNRALQQLAANQLIEVKRKPNMAPRVTLLWEADRASTPTSQRHDEKQDEVEVYQEVIS